jgi:hypothetical protein
MVRPRRSGTTRSSREPIAWPRPAATILPAVLALALLAAPPASNWVWALDGVRSVAPPMAAVLLLAAGAWLVLVLSHRVGIAMLLPQVWRAVGPAFPADDPRARRWLLLWSAVAAAAGVIAVQGQGVQLGRDAGELMLSLRSFFSHVAMPSDIANLLVLIAPLALLAPGLAGGTALRGFLARPEAKLVAIAAAAKRYQASYELAPTPHRGMLGARAWAAAGHVAEALNMLDRLRARSDLEPETRAEADTLARELRR